MTKLAKLSEAPPPASGSVAERIRKERERIGMTFDELSSVCKKSRTTQQYYEAGITEPNADYLYLASLHGADIGSIVTGKAAAGKDEISRQEKELVEGYRASGKAVRAFAIGGMGCVLAARLLMDDSNSGAADTSSLTKLTTGERLKEEREHQGLNQAAFAKVTGISKSKISRFEGGKLSPSIRDLQLLDSCGIDIVYVVCGYFLINLSDEESALVSNYRRQPNDVKSAIAAALSFK